jgi:radical SAM-linked protein
MTEAVAQRVRITFAKGAQLAYIGHLDLVRAWERALRRARVDLAYTTGFNPRPRLYFASALPVGVTSRCEILDILLQEPSEMDDLGARVGVQLPSGLRILQMACVPLDAPSLAARLVSAQYEASIAGMEMLSIRQHIDLLLSQSSVPRTRHREGGVRDYDLRPLVLELSCRAVAPGSCVVHMSLRADQQGTGRADEVLDALELAVHARQVERTSLVFRVGA